MLSQEELFHRYRATLKRDLAPHQKAEFLSRLFSFIRSGTESSQTSYKRKDKFNIRGKTPEYILFFPSKDSLLSQYNRKASTISDNVFFKHLTSDQQSTIFAGNQIYYLLRQWTLPDGHLIFPAFIVKAIPDDINRHYLEQAFTREELQGDSLHRRYPFFEDSYSEFTLQQRAFTDKFRLVSGYNQDVLYPLTYEEVKPFLPYLDHHFQQTPQTLLNPLSLPDF